MIIDIIGGGIGGLTAGIAFKRKGYKVRVFEQATEIKNVGAGIILANNAMQVYKELGLSTKISTKGNRVSAIDIVDENFKTISETSLSVFEKKYELKNIAIHRGVLQKILIDEFTKDELFLGHELEAMELGNKNTVLKFKNDTSYLSEITIGADGIYSKVREIAFKTVEIRKANQLCWRGVLNFELSQEYMHKAIESWGKSTRFGFVKIDEESVYWYALKSEARNNFNTDLDINDFKEYNSLVIEMMNKTENIHMSEISDIKPFKKWNVGTVCLLGDAAHATTPNLGQGACQAIEDAYVLAACFEKYKEVKNAFKAFETVRIKKAHSVVNMSWQLGKIAHLSNPLLMKIRNLLLKKIPKSIHKKQMASLFKLPKL